MLRLPLWYHYNYTITERYVRTVWGTIHTYKTIPQVYIVNPIHIEQTTSKATMYSLITPPIDKNPFP